MGVFRVVRQRLKSGGVDPRCCARRLLVLFPQASIACRHGLFRYSPVCLPLAGSPTFWRKFPEIAGRIAHSSQVGAENCPGRRMCNSLLVKDLRRFIRAGTEKREAATRPADYGSFPPFRHWFLGRYALTGRDNRPLADPFPSLSVMACRPLEFLLSRRPRREDRSPRRARQQPAPSAASACVVRWPDKGKPSILAPELRPRDACRSVADASVRVRVVSCFV
jgi:hypothetical protein